MKNMILTVVLLLSQIIFTVDLSKSYDGQKEYLALKIRSKINPKEKKLYEKQKNHLNFIDESNDLSLPRNTKLASDEKKQALFKLHWIKIFLKQIFLKKKNQSIKNSRI